MNRIVSTLAVIGMASAILVGCSTKTVYVEVPVQVKPTPTPTPKPRPKPVVRYDNPDNFDAVGKPTSYSSGY